MLNGGAGSGGGGGGGGGGGQGVKMRPNARHGKVYNVFWCSKASKEFVQTSLHSRACQTNLAHLGARGAPQ